MKQIGLIGHGRGRIGNMVARVVRGNQIMSVYQPVVANPNTSDQQKARALFKTLSQLGSVLRPLFNEPFRKLATGLQSPTNVFVSRNYPFFRTIGEVTDAISLIGLDLTGSQITAGMFSPDPGGVEGYASITQNGVVTLNPSKIHDYLLNVEGYSEADADYFRVHMGIVKPYTGSDSQYGVYMHGSTTRYIQFSDSTPAPIEIQILGSDFDHSTDVLILYFSWIPKNSNRTAYSQISMAEREVSVQTRQGISGAGYNYSSTLYSFTATA